MVTAAPFAMKCSESDKVSADETNPNFSNCETIKADNRNTASASTAKGFKGKSMMVVSNCAAAI